LASVSTDQETQATALWSVGFKKKSQTISYVAIFRLAPAVDDYQTDFKQEDKL